MIQRSHYQLLEERINGNQRLIQVLYGPRQVGKTTLVLQLLEQTKMNHFYVAADAVPASDHSWLVNQWETARIRMDQTGINEFLLVIDEIQKIENWSEMVKLLWDADTRSGRNLKVVLLGSSRILLQQGLTESLAGRFETMYVGHWSYREMHEAFGWNQKQYAWFGGYPGSAQLVEDEERWKSYVRQSLIETSISKDILMLTRVDKPALMKRLFEIGCVYSSQILSYTKILGQLQESGNTTTLSHYLELLDTAGLLAGIEKYAGNIIRKRGSVPKFQVHNNALLSAQRGETFSAIVQSPAEWGRVIESAIGAHLLNNSITQNYSIYYWRERDQEVDFVIEKDNRIIAIEVKSVADRYGSGMKTFQKRFSPDKVLLVGDAGMPYDEFLEIEPVSLF